MREPVILCSYFYAKVVATMCIMAYVINIGASGIFCIFSMVLPVAHKIAELKTTHEAEKSGQKSKNHIHIYWDWMEHIETACLPHNLSKSRF